MSEQEPLVSKHTVEVLSRLAGLDIDPAEAAGLAGPLNSLLTDADRVNEFMSSQREIGPSVRFFHLASREEA